MGAGNGLGPGCARYARRDNRTKKKKLNKKGRDAGNVRAKASYVLVVVVDYYFTHLLV